MDPAGLVRRALASTRNALDILRAGRLGQPYGAPHEVIDQGPHHRLRRYATCARDDGPVALMVPPLMVTSEVYDISPEISSVRALLRSGLDVARDRIYAIGPSMGGMESLALVGRYPDLLRGALAFDAPTDLAARWVTASAVRRVWIEEEVGARPADAPELYAERSPLGMVDAIAASDAAIWCVYSSEDVASGADPHQVPAFLQALADRRGRVVGARLGTWEHGLGWAQGLDGALRLLDLADASAGRYPGAETRFKPQPQPTAQPPVA